MDSKHTPGPWNWVCDNLIGKSGALVIESIPYEGMWINNKDPDARLIAAAPDLLAVAIKSHEPYVGLTDADVIDLYGGGEAALCLALRAAIAKATGQ